MEGSGFEEPSVHLLTTVGVGFPHAPFCQPNVRLVDLKAEIATVAQKSHLAGCSGTCHWWY
jgi:hypothetical protein